MPETDRFICVGPPKFCTKSCVRDVTWICPHLKDRVKQKGIPEKLRLLGPDYGLHCGHCGKILSKEEVDDHWKECPQIQKDLKEAETDG